jgi:hypothetical protein
VTGVLACLMLLFEVLGKLDVTDQLLDAFSWGEIVTEGMVVALIGWTGRLALREMKTGRTTSRGALEARAQVESLFKMADMLQSAIGYGDANSVLRATAARLLPGLGGSLYIFNNSGDRLELSTSWNWAEGQAPAETISPSQCWALKRGKSHLNLLGLDALRCQHHVGDAVVLEIPMMARGEV